MESEQLALDIGTGATKPADYPAESFTKAVGIGCENTAKWLVEHDAEADRLHRIDRARAALEQSRPPLTWLARGAGA